MSQSLATLADAVLTDLGDIADIFPDGFIARSLNEGQRRLAPDILLQKAVDADISGGASTYTLPTDCYDVLDLVTRPGQTSVYLPSWTRIEGTLYFESELTADFAGRLFYRAFYPEVTDTADCQLGDAACDAIVSYALYKAFRRLAASRSEYRKFSTIVGNGTSMGDLEQAADLHLKDFEDARDSAMRLLPPLSPFTGD